MTHGEARGGRAALPLVLDGHNDALLRLYEALPADPTSFLKGEDKGHLDLPRALEGGLGGGFFAVWVPDDGEDTWGDAMPPERPLGATLDRGRATRVAGGMADILLDLEAGSGGAFRVVRTVDAIEECLDSGVLAAIMHIEGADMISPDLDELEPLYGRGLRSLGIVWSRGNVFGEGVPFRFPSSPDTGPGLSREGKALVRACNRLGIMVDLAHLNYKGFWDVAEVSDAPLVASHSNAHAICAMSRNLTDDQLRAVRDSGGLVGVNFAVKFLREDGEDDPATPISHLVRHVDYLVELMGIEHVALGSDFDGAHIPDEIGDVRGLPRILRALQERGYSDQALRQIAHENWLRVLRLTWK